MSDYIKSDAPHLINKAEPAKTSESSQVPKKDTEYSKDQNEAQSLGTGHGKDKPTSKSEININAALSNLHNCRASDEVIAQVENRSVPSATVGKSNGGIELG